MFNRLTLKAISIVLNGTISIRIKLVNDIVLTAQLSFILWIWPSHSIFSIQFSLPPKSPPCIPLNIPFNHLTSEYLTYYNAHVIHWLPSKYYLRIFLHLDRCRKNKSGSYPTENASSQILSFFIQFDLVVFCRKIP